MATQAVYGYTGLDEGIRLLIQGRVLLTGNCTASKTITVGSNKIFAASNAVNLRDDDTAAEAGTVASLTGETTVTLSANPAGTFTIAKNATIGLVTPPIAFGTTGFVAGGEPRLIADWDDATAFPCAFVEHVSDDGGSSGGGNACYHIRHVYRIYIAQKITAATFPKQLMRTSLDAVMNLLSQDIRLGGQAWHRVIQGSAVDSPRLPRFVGLLGGEVQVGEITVQATQWKARTL